MKVKISETFECLGQIPQIPRVNFETTSQFQILYHSSLSWRIFPLYYYISNITYFGEKELIKVQYFGTV